MQSSKQMDGFSHLTDVCEEAECFLAELTSAQSMTLHI